MFLPLLNSGHTHIHAGFISKIRAGLEGLAFFRNKENVDEVVQNLAKGIGQGLPCTDRELARGVRDLMHELTKNAGAPPRPGDKPALRQIFDAIVYGLLEKAELGDSNAKKILNSLNNMLRAMTATIESKKGKPVDWNEVLDKIEHITEKLMGDKQGAHALLKKMQENTFFQQSNQTLGEISRTAKNLNDLITYVKVVTMCSVPLLYGSF